MAEKELSVLDPHEAVKAIGAASAVVAESRGGELNPVTRIRASPLVPKKRFADEMTGAPSKVFAKGLKAAQVAAIPGRAPRRNEHPRLLRMKPITGVDSERLVCGLCRDDEPLRFPGLPQILEMTVPAGTFVAKIPRINALAFPE